MNLSQFNNCSQEKQQSILNQYSSFITLHYWIALGLIISIVLIASLMFALPQYKVWKRSMDGKALLSQAVQDRQIRIEEAKAKKESAEYEKQAEITRAEGLDKANKIISGSLGGPEGYLRYLQIDAMKEGNCQVIYVPTEANLPITEATRLNIVGEENEKN